MLIQTVSVACLVAALSSPAPAQSDAYRVKKARRHFISLTFDKQFIQAYGFQKHPLEELLGQPVDEVHFENFQYRTRDQQTAVNVVEYGKRATGIGATLYPLGSSEGATLAIRGSIESLPDIRVAFSGATVPATYELTNGRAMDLGVGIEMSDRSSGWGLGSHAFIVGGVGRAQTDQMNGSRYWGEGGGGIMFGPFGVDIAVKYAINRFSNPAGFSSGTHSVHMIPVSVRGTLTF